MVIEFTQARLYVCVFMHNKKITKQKFIPGLNTVSDKVGEDLFKHPGVKNRIKLGILKVIEEMKPKAAPKTEKTEEEKAAAEAKKLAAAKKKADAEAKKLAEGK